MTEKQIKETEVWKTAYEISDKLTQYALENARTWKMRTYILSIYLAILSIAYILLLILHYYK